MNVTALNNAADVLQREANRCEQLAAAAKTIGDVGALFSRVDEAGRVLDDLRGKISDAQTELAQAKHDVEVAKAQALDLVKDGNAQADAMMESARQRCGKELADAAAKRDSILAEVNAAAERIMEGWTDSIEQARKTLQALNEDTADAQRSVEVTRAELAAVQGKLAEAKAALERITASVKGD